MKKHIVLLALLVLIIASFASCFPGNMNYTIKSPAGFFTGIWHGWIAPISLIVGLFKDSVRIYEMNNTGWWYDFGFYIAIIAGFGGVALSRKKRKSD